MLSGWLASGMQWLAESPQGETTAGTALQELPTKGKGRRDIILIAAELLNAPGLPSRRIFTCKIPNDTSGYLVLNPSATRDSSTGNPPWNSHPHPSGGKPDLPGGVVSTAIDQWLFVLEHCCCRQGCRSSFSIGRGQPLVYSLPSLLTKAHVDALSPERSIKIQQILAIMKF